MMAKTFYYGYDRVTRELDFDSHGSEYERADTDTENYLSQNVYTTYEAVKENSWESFVTDFDAKEFWIVAAVYSFGCDSGHGFIIVKAYPDKESAEKLEKVVAASNDYTIEYEGEILYLPWHGYFESLDYTRVIKVTVVD
jgi:hypothetical protein